MTDDVFAFLKQDSAHAVKRLQQWLAMPQCEHRPGVHRRDRPGSAVGRSKH